MRSLFEAVSKHKLCRHYSVDLHSYGQKGSWHYYIKPAKIHQDFLKPDFLRIGYIFNCWTSFGIGKNLLRICTRIPLNWTKCLKPISYVFDSQNLISTFTHSRKPLTLQCGKLKSPSFYKSLGGGFLPLHLKDFNTITCLEMALAYYEGIYKATDTIINLNGKKLNSR